MRRLSGRTIRATTLSITAAFAVGTLAASVALAQTTPVTTIPATILDPVSIDALRTARPVSQVPGSVSVVEGEQIERQQPNTYGDLIRNLPTQVAGWPANQRLETDHIGAVPRVNVSIKISSLSARTDPIDTEGAMRDLMGRLIPILETARDRGVLVNFDMEQFALKDFVLEVFQRCCEKVDFQAGLATYDAAGHAATTKEVLRAAA